jgi:GT2 family glycosyltransferase
MISIITITYNNFNELKTTLNSIPAVNYVESVVINGGNDNETLEYLKDSNGIVINESDSGISEAFNKGIRHSSGEYVMFLNSGDVLLDPGYLQIANNILDKEKDISFVHSNIIFQDMIAGEIFMCPQMKSVGRGQPYFHPTMIVRKKCFDEVGYFDTSYKISMDFDFVVRLEKHLQKGKYIDGKAVVKMEGTGKSAKQEKESIKECYRSLKENDSLTLKNQLGFLERKILFFGRNLFVMIGMKDILGQLKRQKHSV